MKIEILNTGSELLLGTTLNTHGQWLGQELSKLGLRVQRLTTVPDGSPIAEALAESVKRADVVLITGGLGPTSDDVTREATAQVLGIDLIEDEAAMRSLEAFFERLQVEMASDNRKQAQVPVGADVIPNPNGTAPGIYVPPRLNGAANCAVFLLPGPPRELHPMFRDEVVPRLCSLGGIEEVDHTVLELRMTGVGESDVHQTIDVTLSEIDGLEVGYCARLAEVDVRLIGSPAVVDQGRQVVMQSFADEVFSDQGTPLEQVVVGLLAASKMTIATAESCTGGLISNRLTNVPGSSEVFTHGYVTYANEAKAELLGVDEADLEEHGAVSEPVAKQMAEGALKASGADIAVAVTGIAGPGGGTDEKPVGTVFLAVAAKDRETIVLRQMHYRDRISFKQTVSQAALDLLRKNVARASGLRESVPDSGRDCGASSGPIFRALRKEGVEVTKGQRRLPHWVQEGCCYFVTFRTADSLPPSVMKDWETRRAKWLEMRGIKREKYQAYDLSSLNFDDQREYDRVFVKAQQTELDRGHGACMLKKSKNAEIVAGALRYFDGERYDLGDYVIMPNHVHLLVVPKNGHDLGEILRSWKGFTAKEINRSEGREGSFWQKESWDHIVRSVKQLERFQDYIEQNPVMAKLERGEFLAKRVEWRFDAS